MKIISLALGALGTNCYIVSSEKNNAVVIDPSCNAVRIQSELEKNKLNLKMILFTHGHFDHIMAGEELREHYSVPVYVHSDDLSMLTDTEKNLLDDFPLGEQFYPIVNAETVNDRDVLSVDELEFKVIHTPGHSMGSCCYLCENVIFSGDTIFAGSIGRTDFKGSSFTAMNNSLKKINSLTGEYRILPGHGSETTLTQERRQNIYLAGLEIY